MRCYVAVLLLFAVLHLVHAAEADTETYQGLVSFTKSVEGPTKLGQPVSFKAHVCCVPDANKKRDKVFPTNEACVPKSGAQVRFLTNQKNGYFTILGTFSTDSNGNCELNAVTQLPLGFNRVRADIETGTCSPAGDLIIVDMLHEVVAYASVQADPVFTGFHGQRFSFTGQPSHFYHLYSDPYLSINTLFIAANQVKHGGTIVGAVGVRWANSTMLFELASRNAATGVLSFDVSGAMRAMSSNRTEKIHIDNCVTMRYYKNNVHISTPMHMIDISWEKHHANDHIESEYYLDVLVDTPFDDVNLVGGLLGHTVNPKSVSAPKEAQVECSGLLANDSHQNKYSSKEFTCIA